MDNSKKKNNKVFVIVLSVLCVIIVALVIVIIVSKLSSFDSEGVSSEESFDYYYNTAIEIMDEDIEKNRSEEAIDYAKKADELVKTEDSAVLVMNIAAFYGLDDIYDEYAEILRTRQIEMGLDPDTGGEG